MSHAGYKHGIDFPSLPLPLGVGFCCQGANAAIASSVGLIRSRALKSNLQSSAWSIGSAGFLNKAQATGKKSNYIKMLLTTRQTICAYFSLLGLEEASRSGSKGDGNNSPASWEDIISRACSPDPTQCLNSINSRLYSPLVCFANISFLSKRSCSTQAAAGELQPYQLLLHSKNLKSGWV